jgi:hypothetical protein
LPLLDLGRDARIQGCTGRQPGPGWGKTAPQHTLVVATAVVASTDACQIRIRGKDLAAVFPCDRRSRAGASVRPPGGHQRRRRVYRGARNHAARLSPLTDADADELIRSVSTALLLLGRCGVPPPTLACWPGCCCAFPGLPTTFPSSPGSNEAKLSEWAETARARDLPNVHAFTRGLDLDALAVIAAVTLPFHNGRSEGVNTKTKMIKRQNVRPRRIHPPLPPHPAQLTLRTVTSESETEPLN